MATESQEHDPAIRPDFLRSRRFILGLLVAAGIILRLYVSYVNAPTIEETHAMVSGLYGLQSNDFRTSDNIPPVAQMLGALPSLLFPVELTPANQFYRYSEIDHASLNKLTESVIVTNSSVFFSLIFLSRMATLLWWTLGAWIVCRWSDELYGENAKLVALILWCFEPSIFARSCLATPDLCVALTCLAATYLFQSGLQVPSGSKVLVAAFLFGVAQLIDFSALLLVALWPLLAMVHDFGTGRRVAPLRTLGLRVGQALFILLISVWVIGSGYGFSKAGFPLREQFQTLGTHEGALPHLLGSLPSPLPSAYVKGIALRLRSIEDRPTTVRVWSDGSEEAWADQRPLTVPALFAKVSTGLWLMVPWGLAIAVRRALVDPRTPDALAVWVPLAIIPLLAHAGLGLLLPMSAIVMVLPFVIVGASGLAGSMAPGRWARGRWAVALVAWVVASGLACYPRPLAYINEITRLTGGIRARMQCAIPGDMGQDILPLKAWQSQHSEAHALGVACRHILDPSSYGLASASLPPIKPGPRIANIPWHAPRLGAFPGYYALDLWNLSGENYAHFLAEEPVAKVGTSTYIYNITQQDADRIRQKMDLPSLEDIHSLNVWLEQNPKARPLGLVSRHALDPRTYGHEFHRPPINPGPQLAKAPWYTLPSGPSPGYYVVDVDYLQHQEYEYFKKFTPVEMIGKSFHVYHLAREEVDRVRGRLDLPPLPSESAGNGGGRGFLEKNFRDSTEGDSRYAIFVPSDYDGKKPYPLILFLHGAGDAGTEGQKYLTVGFPPFVETRKDSFGFIALCPQGHSGSWFPGGADSNRAMEILDQVQRDYNIDSSRIYLTGLSSGGQGTWDLAVRYPERWAAIVPVSSSGCDPKQAPKIKDIPCWCFHNGNDRGSPAEIPKRMIKALREAGGHPRYSEFPELFVPGSHHNAWDAAYDNDDLYQWLILQSSSKNRR